MRPTALPAPQLVAASPAMARELGLEDATASAESARRQGLLPKSVRHVLFFLDGTRMKKSEKKMCFQIVLFSD